MDNFNEIEEMVKLLNELEVEPSINFSRKLVEAVRPYHAFDEEELECTAFFCHLWLRYTCPTAEDVALYMEVFHASVPKEEASRLSGGGEISTDVATAMFVNWFVHNRLLLIPFSRVKKAILKDRNASL